MKVIHYIRFEQILLFAAVLFLFANGAPVNHQEDKNKSKVEVGVKPEDKDQAIVDKTTTSPAPAVTSSRTVAKSPEVAEPPETSGPSGSVDKRSAGLPLLDTQMPESAAGGKAYDDDEVAGSLADDGVLSDEDFYLRTILSDPQLVKDILDEETRLRYFQQVPPELDVDLTPTSMAWYLLATGDIEGVTKMINALVAYGALSLNEARDYRMAVEEEYFQLSEAGIRGLPYQDSMLPVPGYDETEVDYSAALPYPVGIPAFPLPVEYDTSLNQREAQDYQPYVSSLKSESQKSDEDYYYDGIMKELLEAMAKENTENKVENLPEVAENSEKSRLNEKQETSSEKTAPVKSQDSLPSLEDELEGLFRAEEKQNSINKLPQTQKVPEKEMSVEEQLEQLLGDRHQATDSASSKQKQDNRTKILPSLELKTQDKKDNEKKA